jgi:hypothetical protein
VIVPNWPEAELEPKLKLPAALLRVNEMSLTACPASWKSAALKVFVMVMTISPALVVNVAPADKLPLLDDPLTEDVMNAAQVLVDASIRVAARSFNFVFSFIALS